MKVRLAINRNGKIIPTEYIYGSSYYTHSQNITSTNTSSFHHVIIAIIQMRLAGCEQYVQQNQLCMSLHQKWKWMHCVGGTMWRYCCQSLLNFQLFCHIIYPPSLSTISFLCLQCILLTIHRNVLNDSEIQIVMNINSSPQGFTLVGIYRITILLFL